MSRRNLYNGDQQVTSLQAHAVATLEHFDAARTRLANAKDAKRQAEIALANHESDLADKFRADNPDMSHTQFKDNLKYVFGRDEEWRKMRDEVARLESVIETADADRSVLARDIQIATSALMAMGGSLFRSAVESLRSK